MYDLFVVKVMCSFNFLVKLAVYFAWSLIRLLLFSSFFFEICRIIIQIPFCVLLGGILRLLT